MHHTVGPVRLEVMLSKWVKMSNWHLPKEILLTLSHRETTVSGYISYVEILDLGLPGITRR